MRILTAEQMRRVDLLCADRYGVPGYELMERAGRAVATVAGAMLPVPGRILLLAGPGNNGGDGFVAARLLLARGYQVEVVSTQQQDRYRGDAAEALGRLVATGLKPTLWQGALPPATLIVDALLGSGLRGELAEPYRTMVQQVNLAHREGAAVLAVDLPTGLGADAGNGDEILATEADVTLTLGRPKPGLLTHPGSGRAGMLFLADLDIPAAAVEQVGWHSTLILPSAVRCWLGCDGVTSHKGDRGHVVVVGGSRQYPGAPVLAALGALRGGAGLVTVAGPEVPELPAEAMPLRLPADAQGAMSTLSSHRLAALRRPPSVWVAGPGAWMGPGVRSTVMSLVGDATTPLVLDADGLGALGGDLGVLSRLRRDGFPAVLTPHVGELARLLGCGVEEVQGDRVASAREAALRSRSIVVLKGHGTLVAGPEGDLLLNVTGSPILATGGTGDVLAGLIGALLAAGVLPLEAAAAGVFLHGLAGDALAARGLAPGAGAQKLAAELPRARRWLRAPTSGYVDTTHRAFTLDDSDWGD